MDQKIIANKAPYKVDLEAGKTYYWCQCGRSQDQPFCDGAHKVTDIKPIMFKPDTSKTVFLCGCKQTLNTPYCDGTHRTLKG